MRFKLKQILLSALCAFFISAVYADDQKQFLADKAKDLIKQDREAKERQKEQAAQYAIELITGKKQ